MRETSRRPGLLVLVATLALAVATALATLAVFAAEAQADSFDHRPPKGVLMKDGKMLQAQDFTGGEWHWYQNGNGRPAFGIFDNFGSYPFPYSTFQCDRPTSHDADIRSHRRIYPNRHDYIELRAGQCQRNPLSEPRHGEVRGHSLAELPRTPIPRTWVNRI